MPTLVHIRVRSFPLALHHLSAGVTLQRLTIISKMCVEISKLIHQQLAQLPDHMRHHVVLVFQRYQPLEEVCKVPLVGDRIEV